MTESHCWSNKSKSLGVIINNKFKYHISFVGRKVTHGVGVIIKTRKVRRSESLKCLNYPFIYSYMIYCDTVWGSACQTNMESLLILQKKAVRIIFGVHLRCPSEPSFTASMFFNRKSLFRYLICHPMSSTFLYRNVLNQSGWNTRQDMYYFLKPCLIDVVLTLCNLHIQSVLSVTF